MQGEAMSDVDAARKHWRRTLRLALLLLALWLAASFGVALFARDLTFTLFGAPFGVWVAGQGALIVFVLIVWCHVWLSARQERRSQDEGDASA